MPDMHEEKVPRGVAVEDIFHRSPLHLAVNEGNIEKVKELLKEGADVNAKDDFGLTPLLRAVGKKENVKIVQELMKAGADLTATNSVGATASRLAESMGHKVIKEAIEKEKRRRDRQETIRRARLRRTNERNAEIRRVLEGTKVGRATLTALGMLRGGRTTSPTQQTKTLPPRQRRNKTRER